jgi:hypothetical protein
MWILVSLIFSMNNNLNSDPKYHILSIEDLNRIEKTKFSQIDTSYIVDYNGAFVTVFKDRTSILRPPVLGGDEGLLFDNVADMNEMIKSRTFPVKGNNSFWAQEKERVLNFSGSIPYYCNRLTELLDFKVELKDDADYLKEFSEVVNKKLKVKGGRNLLYHYLSIYIGEMIRLKVNGEWRLFPQYALNVYYVPEITKGSQFCSHWNTVIRRLEMAPSMPVNLETLISGANVFYPAAGRKYLR